MSRSRAKTFEEELANTLGNIRAHIERVLEMNPDLPQEVRIALTRSAWKLLPLSSKQELERMRKSYK